MSARPAAIARDAERAAILTRLDELLANPSSVWLTDHYLDRLLSADCND